MAIPTKVIKVISQGPQGSPGTTGAQGATGPQGPSGSADGSFIRKANDNIYYDAGNVGIGQANFELVDPTAELEIRRGEFDNDIANDLFIIKQFDPNTQDLQTRFVVNSEGVTVLGAFTIEPTPIAGGLYYNANGHFFLGFDND